MQISGANIKVSQKGEVVPGTTNRSVPTCLLHPLNILYGLWHGIVHLASTQINVVFNFEILVSRQIMLLPCI